MQTNSIWHISVLCSLAVLELVWATLHPVVEVDVVLGRFFVLQNS